MGATCPAGYTTTATSTLCGGSAASCVASTCCTVTSGTCAATTVSCGSGKYKDSSKNGATAGTSATEHVANCCSTQATCADVPCASSAGLENKFSAPSSQKCLFGVSSCSGCCKAITTSCAAAASNICTTAGTYKAVAATASGAVQNTWLAVAVVSVATSLASWM